MILYFNNDNSRPIEVASYSRNISPAGQSIALTFDSACSTTDINNIVYFAGQSLNAVTIQEDDVIRLSVADQNVSIVYFNETYDREGYRASMALSVGLIVPAGTEEVVAD